MSTTTSYGPGTNANKEFKWEEIHASDCGWFKVYMGSFPNAQEWHPRSLLETQVEDHKWKKTKVTCILSERGGEFFNEIFIQYCDQEGIRHQFLVPRTPQQNGVVERRNRSLVELGRTLLNDQGLLHKFWAEAIKTSCYIWNRCFIRPILGKMTYDIY